MDANYAAFPPSEQMDLSSSAGFSPTEAIFDQPADAPEPGLVGVPSDLDVPELCKATAPDITGKNVKSQKEVRDLEHYPGYGDLCTGAAREIELVTLHLWSGEDFSISAASAPSIQHLVAGVARRQLA